MKEEDLFKNISKIKTLDSFKKEIKNHFYDENKNYIESTSINKEIIIKELKKIHDPEIPVNIYDLGLIYKINIDNRNKVTIDMTLTNPNCPVADTMPKSVVENICKLKNVKSCSLNLVWDPKWNKDFMSEEAKLSLDFF